MLNMNAYGSVTIAICVYVSLCACSVVFIYFLLHKNFSKTLLWFFSMLAVGTLLGDSLLHLIPKSYDLHDHRSVQEHPPHENRTRFNTGNDEHAMLYKGIFVVGSIYMLYLLNWLTFLFKCGHGHNHNGDLFGDNYEHTLHHIRNKPSIEKTDDLLRKDDHQNDRDKYLESFMDEREKEITLEELNNMHLRTENKFQSDEKVKKRSFSQLVYVIFLSALLHNLTDGMAIGVAFSDCLSGGLSTTVAILCHEIPHVIGNFVIIHGTGCKAHLSLIVVLATYISTFLGGYLGVAIGTEFGVTEYIFAVTAGMFLYIAMVQLIPEMLHSISEKRDWPKFWIQNFGFIFGFVIMILISFFEDSISLYL